MRGGLDTRNAIGWLVFAVAYLKIFQLLITGGPLATITGATGLGPYPPALAARQLTMALWDRIDAPAAEPGNDRTDGDSTDGGTDADGTPARWR